jgi:hypothetical protein
MAGENPVIGRKPTPTPTPTPKPAVLPGGLGAAIDKGLGNVGVDPVKGGEIDKIDFIINLTKAEMQQIIPYLKKFGATKTNLSTYPNAKDFLQTNFDTLVTNAKGSVKELIKLFKNEATGYGSKDDEVKSNGVTQYITEKSPALVKDNVDKFLLSTIGSKNIKPESRKVIMDEINKLIDEGVTTTSKRDKSGKTVTTQTAGYSEERAGAVVARVAKELEPGKYEQQKQLNFFDFMQQAEQMRGGR